MTLWLTPRKGLGSTVLLGSGRTSSQLPHSIGPHSCPRKKPTSPPDPRGSKYPILKDPGSKNHTLNGFWDQVLKCWVLGPPGSLHQTEPKEPLLRTDIADLNPRSPVTVLVPGSLPGDSYVVPFWVVFSNPLQENRSEPTKKELHRSRQVCTRYITHRQGTYHVSNRAVRASSTSRPT